MAHQYDVHPGVAMIRKWCDELPAKTGRTLEEWALLVSKSKLATAKERREWLKCDHGLGSNTASQIVAYALDQQTWDGDPDLYLQNAPKYVDDMFAGGKAPLRPLFEAVVEAVRKLGQDAKVCPCKTIVPFYRNRVFAQARPATKTRLELAFALGETPPQGRLQLNPRAKAGDRLTHFIGLAAEDKVDAEIRSWLKAAYRADG